MQGLNGRRVRERQREMQRARKTERKGGSKRGTGENSALLCPINMSFLRLQWKPHMLPLTNDAASKKWTGPEQSFLNMK